MTTATLTKTETVTVWRVEHATSGSGPYNPSHDPGTPWDDANLCDDIVYALTWERDYDEHPSPFEDGMSLDEWSPFLRSAFASEDALLTWFDQDTIDAFRSAHFIVRRYEVPVERVIFMHHQVAYDERYATRIE